MGGMVVWVEWWCWWNGGVGGMVVWVEWWCEWNGVVHDSLNSDDVGSGGVADDFEGRFGLQ